MQNGCFGGERGNSDGILLVSMCLNPFFLRFYMAINVGSAFAYAFLTTLGTNGGMGIPKERIGRWRLELGMDDQRCLGLPGNGVKRVHCCFPP